MTDTRKVQLGAEVDPSGAQQGFRQIEDAATGMASKVGQAAGTAGKAVDGIGEGGQQSAGKVDRATKSIISSIERTTAALKAGEKGSAAYFETLAQQRGVSADALAPYIAQLRQAEEAQRAARASLQGMGVSAAQTAAALRGVPAQFTDIITSLQGGQAPLTVLLQQGGQLRDMFGSTGAAAKALGGFVVGLVNPFTVAAAAAAGLAAAYNSGANESAAFVRAVVLSGQTAGVTAGQLQDMAAAIRATGASTQGRAAEVLLSIADSAEIGRDSMQRFVAAALQLERVGGPAAEKTADAFRSLAKDPLQAALKLNESTNFLTRSTYEQIRALEQQGRTAEAARVAQTAYADAIQQRTPQVEAALGSMERGWNAVKAAIAGAWDAAKGIGREQTARAQLDAVQAAMQRVREAPAGERFRDADGREVAGRAAALESLRQREASLQEQLRLEQRGADAAKARREAVQTSAQWDSEGTKFLSRRIQMEREIEQARRLGLAAGAKQEEIERRVAAIREKFTEKGATAAKLPTYKAEEEAARAYGRAIESLTGIQQQAGASAEGLTKTQAKLRDLQADPAWATYSRQQREQIITAAAVAQAAEDQAAAVKAGAKVATEAARDYQQWLDALAKSGDAVARQVQALQDEEAAARIAATGRLSLKAAIEEVTIARLRDAQVAAMGNPDAVAAIEIEIQQRQKLRDLLQGQEVRKQADEAQKEWAKASEKIGDSITDALLRGFESGKGFAANLRDTVVGMFKSMVLRPVVQAIVQPLGGAVSSLVGGALGLGSSAASAGQLGAGSLGSLGSLLNMGGLAGLGGSLGAFGSGLASGLSAWGAGGSVTGLLSTGVGGLFSGGLASGLGTVAGALGPIGLGIAAIAGLAKAFDNSGTPHYGGSSAFNAATGLQLGAGVGGLGTKAGAYSSEVEALTTQIAQTMTAALDSTARTFGRTAGYTVKAAFADDSSRDPAQGALAILLGGRVVAGSDNSFQRFADGEAGKQLYLERVAADVRTALNDIGLPGWATQLLDKLGAAPSIEQLGQVVDQINATQAALVGLGAALPQLGTLSGAAVNALVDAFGGIGQLGQSATGYLQALYSDTERAAIAQRQVQAELGKLGVATVPATREAYRALVEAQDLTTDGGRRLYAALLQLAPTFAQVTEAAIQANAGLQAEIDRLRGSGPAASQAQALAQFAAATAQARAGDASARQQLPALSQAVEQAAQLSATTAAELTRVRAWLASSLQQTIGDGAMPGLSPTVAPAAGMQAAADATAQQLAAMTERIAALEEPMRASALASARTARLIERVIPEGDALAVRITT